MIDLPSENYRVLVCLSDVAELFAENDVVSLLESRLTKFAQLFSFQHGTFRCHFIACRYAFTLTSLLHKFIQDLTPPSNEKWNHDFSSKSMKEELLYSLKDIRVLRQCLQAIVYVGWMPHVPTALTSNVTWSGKGFLQTPLSSSYNDGSGCHDRLDCLYKSVHKCLSLENEFVSSILHRDLYQQTLICLLYLKFLPGKKSLDCKFDEVWLLKRIAEFIDTHPLNDALKTLFLMRGSSGSESSKSHAVSWFQKIISCYISFCIRKESGLASIIRLLSQNEEFADASRVSESVCNVINHPYCYGFSAESYFSSVWHQILNSANKVESERFLHLYFCIILHALQSPSTSHIMQEMIMTSLFQNKDNINFSVNALHAILVKGHITGHSIESFKFLLPVLLSTQLFLSRDDLSSGLDSLLPKLKDILKKFALSSDLSCEEFFQLLKSLQSKAPNSNDNQTFVIVNPSLNLQKISHIQKKVEDVLRVFASYFEHDFCENFSVFLLQKFAKILFSSSKGEGFASIDAYIMLLMSHSSSSTELDDMIITMTALPIMLERIPQKTFSVSNAKVIFDAISSIFSFYIHSGQTYLKEPDKSILQVFLKTLLLLFNGERGSNVSSLMHLISVPFLLAELDALTSLANENESLDDFLSLISLLKIKVNLFVNAKEGELDCESGNSSYKPIPLLMEVTSELQLECIVTKGAALIKLYRCLKNADKNILTNSNLIDDLINILKNLLTHPDTYIYLNTIRAFSVLAEIKSNHVVPILIESFARSSYQEYSECDKVLVGEVICKTLQKLGPISCKWEREFLNAFISHISSPDPIIKACSLSILGEYFKVNPLATSGTIHQMYAYIKNIWSSDCDSENVLCAASFVILCLIQGLRCKNLFEISTILPHLCKDVYFHFCSTSRPAFKMSLQLILEEFDDIFRQFIQEIS